MALGSFWIIASFSILSIFSILSCSGDLNYEQTMKKEVEDFEEFLRQKTEKEIASERRNHLRQPLKDSGGFYEADNIDLKNQVSSSSENFGSLLEKRFHNTPDTKIYSPDEHIAFRQSSGNDPIPSEVHSSLPVEDHRHPVEQILYIRRSDSETNDPVVDVLDKLVQKDTAREVTSNLGSEDNSEILLKDEPPSDDPCFSNNFSSHLHQTCSGGPEYEMEFPPTFSEALSEDFDKMLLPEKENKCDYNKILTTSDGVEDRALCPFHWAKTQQNKSRFPEYLYEAKCSCQISREIGGIQYECKEVKRVIPVLWIVDCGPGTKKRYKEGWEEVSVACAPVVHKDSNKFPNNRDPR